MREAASSGKLKRYCKACGKWVEDEDSTRSKYCVLHRRRRHGGSIVEAKPLKAGFTAKQQGWLKAFEALTGMEAMYQDEFLSGQFTFTDFVAENREYICEIAASIPRAPIEDDFDQ